MPEFENVMLLRHFQRLDPQPSSIGVPACKQAIEAAIDGDLDRQLRLPLHSTTTAREILEPFNLNPSGVSTLRE
jgi:hypothetical protein